MKPEKKAALATAAQWREHHARLVACLAGPGWISEGSAQDRGPGAGGPCYQWTRKVRGKTVSVALSAEQFAWLQQDLEAHKNMHICLISHIPILSIATFLDGDNEKGGHWSLPDEWMHIDARRMKDLFLKYPNVHLCISGHMHMVDRVLYNSVTYICDGAVCGAWWKGKNFEFSEGYGIFDLFDDGTFEHEYINYGWKAV